MTSAAEIRALDDHAGVRPLARLVARRGANPVVVELADGGGDVARRLLVPNLEDPEGRRVAATDGADYLRVLRWVASGERLWVTPTVDLPEATALDASTVFPDVDEPFVPATVPYPEPAAALDGVELVEVCRPRLDDLLRIDIVTRVVQARDGRITVEPVDAEATAEVRARLAGVRRDEALETLLRHPIRRGLAARRVRFDRPFDKASRDGLVRVMRDVAPGSAARSRLEAEYLTRLPRLWLSRDPVGGDVLRLALDAYGFDGPFFDAVHPLRPESPVPAAFLGLHAEAPPHAGTAELDPAWKADPPWLDLDLMEDPGTTAVLSMVHVGRTPVWLAAYYGPSDPTAERGVSWRHEPDRRAMRRTVDLARWAKAGRLRWIAPFDPSVTLQSGPLPASYLAS